MAYPQIEVEIEIPAFNPTSVFKYTDLTATLKSQLIQFDLNTKHDGTIRVEDDTDGVCRILTGPSTDIVEVEPVIHSFDGGPSIPTSVDITVENLEGDGSPGDGKHQRWLRVHIKKGDGAPIRGSITLFFNVTVQQAL